MIKRSQEFGFHIENLVRTLVHKLEPRKNNISIHDISKEENVFDTSETISIKTTGSNSIDCGDALRLYDYDYDEKHTMYVFCYKQNTSTRVITRILEISMNQEFKKVMFGSVTRDDIKALDSYIKSIPKNKKTKEHTKTYKLMAKKLKNDGYISYAPKVDSKSQRRLQCSIRNLDTFISNHKSLIVSDTTDCKIKNIEFPKVHEGFGKRVRKPKSNLAQDSTLA